MVSYKATAPAPQITSYVIQWQPQLGKLIDSHQIGTVELGEAD